MTEPVHNITNVGATPLPEKPSPTRELEGEADTAMRYLERLASNQSLDPELRMALNDIRNTIKSLKHTVQQQSSEAQRNHDRIVELTRAQRLI